MILFYILLRNLSLSFILLVLALLYKICPVDKFSVEFSTLMPLLHLSLETLKKTLWPLLMDRVQLSQGQSHFKEAVYFLSLSSQKLVLILSTLEG